MPKIELSEQIKQFIIENKNSNNHNEEFLNIYQSIGLFLRYELYSGGYRIADINQDENRVIDGEKDYIKLYDNSGSYAVYCKKELDKVLETLGLKWDVENPIDHNLFEAFPVKDYMDLFGDMISRHGVVTDGYTIIDKIVVNDTEFYTEQWFDSFDLRECDDIDHLANDLYNYVNDTENDYIKFEDYKTVSQWEAFCAFTGYPKREDYFCVLSDKADYEYLYQNETYIDLDDCKEAIKKAIEEEKEK